MPEPTAAASNSYVLSPDTVAFVDRASRCDRPVFLYGETGTGKTLLARHIHDRGARRDKPFERLDAATCPPSLLSTHLFGCERGAFTDAREARRGLAELAQGGTLFLDELDGLGFEEQRMLLTLCQDGVIRRVGASTEVRVDVRVIAASNAPVPELLKKQRLRADLYYRLAVFFHRLTPLRERLAELPTLVTTILPSLIARMGCDLDPATRVDADTLNVLSAYDWPGNIRELENVLEQAISLSDSSGAAFGVHVRQALASHVTTLSTTCDNEHLPLTMPSSNQRRPYYRAPADPGAEQRRIADALRLAQGGRLEDACQALGMSRHTLWRKMRRYGIRPADWRS